MVQCQCVRSFKALVIGPENALDKFGPSVGVGHVRFCSLPLRAKAPTWQVALAAEQRTRLTFPCDHGLQAGLRHPFTNRNINYTSTLLFLKLHVCTGLLLPQLGAFLSLTRPLHCRFLAAMVGRRCAMAGQDTPPHRTAPIRCCFFQFDCFSGEMEIIEHLSLSHRALAQRTRSHPRAITSPRPRLLLELPSSTAALQAPASEEYIRSNRVRRRRRCGSRPPLVPSPVRKLNILAPN